MTRSLIVNADDYGSTHGVSAGIRHAHLHGIVTTTTVLINLPGAAEDVRGAMAESPGLGIGLHLNLTAGTPCAAPDAVPDLIGPSGAFHTPDQLRPRLSELDAYQVRTEWRAQLSALEATGVVVDHLDSHHHLAALAPDLWEICLGLAIECGCRVRAACPIDEADETLLGDAPPGSQDFARHHAAALQASFGLGPSPHLFTKFYDSGAALDVLLGLADRLPEGVSEIMCHPGFSDASLEAVSSYTGGRQSEHDILTDPQAQEKLRSLGILLDTYRSAWGHDA
jgi:predicted glycoside hydrolase/deacetylase ChbG (UPF0249 family)